MFSFWSTKIPPLHRKLSEAGSFRKFFFSLSIRTEMDKEKSSSIQEMISSSD
ncbi:hypothetical protein [Sphingobacterium paucimobilis]|uniref:Uncharacterized protein n=1 Tax=Sphingobacterium paucimobilis HER1398 TaxID=1346330 RepID=U2HTL2_9SPHI|nr:hypothetical protein [Sphingobacterium paucimobilis]ERJ58852.1 hypothetical protein M472_08725 [Sphingobacterium paucimobilis HER1398]